MKKTKLKIALEGYLYELIHNEDLGSKIEKGVIKIIPNQNGEKMLVTMNIGFSGGELVDGFEIDLSPAKIEY